ncbi:hypothetical protein ABW19_dt0207301 [Dactylella cylindrospora]|nr:hypothetical protein ABW19_dt0207301 [Dactylella cylindrospora]
MGMDPRSRHPNKPFDDRGRNGWVTDHTHGDITSSGTVLSGTTAIHAQVVNIGSGSGGGGGGGPWDGWPGSGNDRSNEGYNQYYVVSKRSSDRFTGRGDILKELSLKCLPLPQLAPVRGDVRNVFVLYGLGGSGKTQVALKFAEHYRQRFWAIFWIDASTKRTAEQSLLDIAAARDPSILEKPQMRETEFRRNLISATKTWLANSPKPWLLILDNADDVDMKFKEYYPVSSHGYVIITTRDATAGKKYATVGYRKITEMPEEDAVRLLLRCFSSENPELSDPNIRLKAQKIVKELGYLPLAISQASGAIGVGLCTIDEFSRSMAHREFLLKEKHGFDTEDYGYTIDTVWEVSRRYLARRSEGWMNKADSRARIAQRALNILSLLSLIHFTGISEVFFFKAWDYCNTGEGRGYYEDLNTLLFEHGNKSTGTLTFLQSINLLSSLSLIQYDKPIISMHPLVHRWARGRIAGNHIHRWEARGTDFIFIATPKSEGAEEAGLRRQLLPHVDALRRHMPNVDFLYHVVERRFHGRSFAHIFFENGKEEDAIEILEAQIGHYEKYGKGDEMMKFTTMGDLASCYSQVGDTQSALEALELSQTVLAGYTKHLGVLDSRTIYRMGKVAGCLWDVGREKEALEMYLEAKDRSAKVSGIANPETLRLVANIAVIYGEMRQFRKAIELEKEAVGIIMKDEIEHPVSIQLIENLAMSYAREGATQDLRKGLELMTTVVEVRKRLLGADHPLTIMSTEVLRRMTMAFREANPVPPPLPARNVKPQPSLQSRSRDVTESEREGPGESSKAAGLSLVRRLSIKFMAGDENAPYRERGEGEKHVGMLKDAKRRLMGFKSGAELRSRFAAPEDLDSDESEEEEGGVKLSGSWPHPFPPRGVGRGRPLSGHQMENENLAYGGGTTFEGPRHHGGIEGRDERRERKMMKKEQRMQGLAFERSRRRRGHGDEDRERIRREEEIRRMVIDVGERRGRVEIPDTPDADDRIHYGNGQEEDSNQGRYSQDGAYEDDPWVWEQIVHDQMHNVVGGWMSKLWNSRREK